mgnify:CR=1 FL=1
MDSERYAEREAASRQPGELGKRAMPALWEAVKSRNPEVGQRSRRFFDNLALASKAVELSPKQHKYRDTLAEVNFHLENRERAVEVAKEGLKIAPEDEHLEAQLKRFESEGTKE